MGEFKLSEINRRRKGRRLSIFTDLLILVAILIVALPLAMKLKGNNLSDSEELALGDIEPYERNALLIDKIYKEFGVKVVYGEQSRDDAEKVGASVQEDEYVVTNNLIHIYETFLDYPKEYFKDNNLTVVILSNFSNSNIALASRNSLNQYKIYISNARDYYRSLNHEMYHVFEYMLDSEFRRTIDSEWYEFNPRNFAYDSSLYNLDETWVYYEGCDLENAYFVSKYSKASGKEDRAETFAEMMKYETDNQPYFNISNSHIMEKASYILKLLNYKYGEKEEHKWNVTT